MGVGVGVVSSRGRSRSRSSSSRSSNYVSKRLARNMATMLNLSPYTRERTGNE